VPRLPWLLAAPWLLLACGNGAEPGATPEPAEVASPAQAAASHEHLSDTLAEWVTKDWSALRGAREEKCDESKWGELPADERTLVLAVRDARFEKKNLLPLALTGPLTQPRLHALRDQLALAPPGRPPSELLAGEISALERRRFAGVFHVTEHYGAERVFRTDRGRWEWMPGTLVAWLAVHDGRTGAALCQTLLVVKNDTRSAPLAPRLKSDTRERLTRDLGRDVRAEAARALSRISTRLELPETPEVPTTAQR